MKKKALISFELLYNSYYPKLVAFASFFLKNDEAHDVVQDVFLSLLEKSLKNADEKTIDAYLYKAVKNKCIDFIRHKIIKDQYATEAGKELLKMEAEYFYSSRNEIEENLMSKELREKIDSAIETLPSKGKRIFNLYFLHSKKAKEIAAILNISPSTVENHIYMSIKSLRKKILDS